jgi:site-specific DNA recombinase
LEKPRFAFTVCGFRGGQPVTPTSATKNSSWSEATTDGAARAVLYLRVSTKEQASKGGEAEGFSIPAQRDAGARKAATLGAAVIAEFVDAGESARRADRPELQRMLAFIREESVDYVIVHKIDRLARNRADDIDITLSIQATGARLVSCTENIDETPSGLLLHGIMSSIAEFYSRNLANEVTKGLVQKARSGGTPGKAPIGYLNVRKFENGRELRTVEVDPIRGPLMRWAFEAYASGNWRLQPLREELTRRGLDVPATRSKPATKLGVSRLHDALRHPYYKGIVTYRGVEYEGQHEPLVSPASWQRVQEVLTAHNHAGEKQRRHNHYLKSSLFCGRCESRMIVTHSLSATGRRYSYFTCIGKHTKRTGCTMRAVSMEALAELVEDYYETVQLPTEIRQVIEEKLREDLQAHYDEARAQHQSHVKRRTRLLTERRKLLELHYAGAIPLDLVKEEQQRIADELALIKRHFETTEDHQALVEQNLRRALDLAADCHAAYRGAPPLIRRLLNQVFFKKLYVIDESIVGSELASPFDILLGEAVLENGNAPKDVVRTGAQKTLRALKALSVKELKLVAGAGFEPATSGL